MVVMDVGGLLLDDGLVEVVKGGVVAPTPPSTDLLSVGRLSTVIVVCDTVLAGGACCCCGCRVVSVGAGGCTTVGVAVGVGRGAW